MFPRMFKWKECRITFKFDLWEIFMAWGDGKPGERLKKNFGGTWWRAATHMELKGWAFR